MVVNLGHFDIHHPTADQLGLVSNFLLDAVRPGDLRDSLLLQEGDEAQRTMNVVYAWVHAQPDFDSHPLRRSAIYLLRDLSDMSGKLPVQLDITDLKVDKENIMANTENATVYMGEHEGKPVAIKQFHGSQNNALWRKYFYRECFAWSQLKHKYILSLVGIYRDPQPMMVSPLAVHRTLEHFVEDRALYNPKEDQERFADQIAQGMTYLHMKKVVHGDVKSSNILINKLKQVQIADFGLATLGDVTFRQFTPTSPRGTPGWEAPERHETGEGNFARTYAMDVWAYGLLCFMLAKGGYPWPTKNTTKINDMITKGETPDSPPSMSIGLGDLAKKCMAYDPEDRLSMAHVMAYFKHAWHSFLPEHPSTIVKAKKSFSTLFTEGNTISWLHFLETDKLEILEFRNGGKWLARRIKDGIVGWVPSDFSYFHDPTVMRARALEDFQASDEEHAKNWLSFSKKDTFDILAFSRQGCIWLARTSENQVGMILSAQLKPLWPKFTGEVTFPRRKTLFAYTPPSDLKHALELWKDDVLEVLYRDVSNQWYVGHRKSDGKIGIIPSHHLQGTSIIR